MFVFGINTATLTQEGRSAFVDELKRQRDEEPTPAQVASPFTPTPRRVKSIQAKALDVLGTPEGVE